MTFTVDAWDPGYGSSFDLDAPADAEQPGLAASTGEVQLDVEVPADRWAPITTPTGVRVPARVLFVDGVRRIEARAWIAPDEPSASEEPAGSAGPDADLALCASIAAGVVCCERDRAHLLAARVERGLFTVAPHAPDVVTTAGTWTARISPPAADQPVVAALSWALQRRLGELEQQVSGAARQGAGDKDDLLVVDGPLRGRAAVPRTVGYVKSHRTAYLTGRHQGVVARLGAGERTPVFRTGPEFGRWSWYLRLPGPAGSPWAGIVRLECPPDSDPTDVIGVARLTQVLLPRFASVGYKDTRAPQNLSPIAGLERELRRRLGDERLLYRALRVAAGA